MLRRRTTQVIAGVIALLVLLLVFYRFAFDGEVLVSRELFRLFIPESALLHDALVRFEWPLWNPYVRMGQPFAASMQAQAFYPPRVLMVALFGPVVGMTALQLLHAALAAAGVWWLVSGWVRRPSVAWVSGAAFALTPLFTQLSSQPNVVSAAAWSGFLLAAAVRGHPRAFGAFLGLSLLAASPETTLWQLLLVAMLGRREWRLLGGALSGVGLAAPMLLPAAELALQSVRGTAGFSPGTWSMSWSQVVASWWPMFDRPRDDYWHGDDQWFVTQVFLGTLPVVLAVAGIAGGRREARLLGLGALSLLLFSLGTHFAPVRWLLELPPFNWFRFPAKAWVGVAFCVAALTGPGLEVVVRAARRFRPKPRWALAPVVVVLVLLAASRALLHAPPLRAGALEYAAWPLLALGGAAACLFLVPPGARRTRWLARAWCICCVVELVAARRVLTTIEPDAVADHTHASLAASLLPRPFTGRISAGIVGGTDDFPPDGSSFTAGSRDWLVPTRFIEERLESVDGYGAPEPARFERLRRGHARGFFDLAGVTHFLVEKAPPFDDLTKVAELPAGAGLYASSTALPRAFVVQQAVRATDEEALRAIEDPSQHQPFRHTVFLAEGEVKNRAPCTSEVARRTTGLSSAVYDVRACDDGYLVMTDSYFPGWHASLDGVSLPVSRADFAFLAVEVPRGRHEVRLHYRPASFTWGLTAFVAALLGLSVSFARRRA